MSHPVLYEHPLNERIRILLRLEYFFSQASHFRNEAALWDSQAGVSAIIEILSILERNDVKSEILKELERHISSLSRYLDTPTIDRKRLDHTLDKLNAQVKKLHTITTKCGTDCRDNELLTNIRQRTNISGGTCGFDIPAYHYWLNQPTETRSECISHWLSEFRPIQEGIHLLLTTLRNSAFFEQKTAESGFFQQVLDPQHPCQLLRIALPIDCGTYPEVSGSKHRINIRLLSFPESGRPKQISHNFDFDICCCVI